MASRKHTTQLAFSFTEAEIWRPVVGYEGLYEVSNLGRVRSLDKPTCVGSRTRRKQGRVLRLLKRKKKYLAVRLSKTGQITTLNVHTLVLTAFVGPRPEGLTCNHIDGNSLNNVAGNLESVLLPKGSSLSLACCQPYPGGYDRNTRNYRRTDGRPGR